MSADELSPYVQDVIAAAAERRLTGAERDAILAALDAEDGDGLAEIARISADADLYQRTDGVVIRREDGDE